MISSGDQEVIYPPFQININYYLHLVCYVILYYDYILMLPTEIQRFWNLHSFSWAAFFFFLNRYLALLGHIPVIMLTFWNSGDLAHKFKMLVCRRLYSYHQYLEIGIQLVVGVLLIMRVYALYDQNRWVVVFFITFATIDVGIACWAVVSKDPIKLPPQDFAVSAPGCAEPISDKQGVRFVVAWSGQLAFDAIVFCLTLYKSLLIVRTSHRPLISTLLRDGALYFAILTIANLANILTYLLAVSLSKGLTSTFVNIISATMISRLMLNLRDPNILTPSINRTTITENSTSRLYPMMSTVVDPSPFTIPYIEDKHVDTRGEVAPPIENIELMPLNQNLDSKA